MLKLIMNGLIGGLVQVALFGLALLVPAGLVSGGTWYWRRGLIFLGVFGVVLETSVVILALVAPASLAARLRSPASKMQPVADRVATGALVLSTLAWFVFIPVDVFHLKLLPPPSLDVSLLGAALSLVGFAVIMAAIYQNSYAIPIVEDQSGWAQVLVDTGLYAHVRHPFYLGLLLFYAGLALWLESYASLLTLFFVLLALLARIAVEETMLWKTLPAYSMYVIRVPYRLVPLVW
jgi:protein-S-isoprenylcysteine O-methyltransferase Ste14